MAWDRLAIMGNDKEIVAVLEATSVNAVINVTVLITITSGLASPSSTASCVAT